MGEVLLKIEKYENKERFSLGQILRNVKLTTKKDQIDHYVLGILEGKEGLNISKDYIEQEFGLDYFFEYLEYQARIIKNSYALTRYYEILWFFRNVFSGIKRNEEHRIGFIENTLLSIKEKKIKDNYRIEDMLEKALNECEKNEKLECEVFEKLIKRGEEHKSATSVFDIVDKYKNKKKIMKEKALELVEEEWQELLKESKESSYEFIDHLKILLKYYENDNDKINNLLEVVINYFKCFEGLAIRGSLFINELLTDNLIKKIINKNKINIKLIDDLKKLSLKMGRNIKFGTIEAKIEVSREEMEKIFRIFILDTQEKSIKMLLYEHLKVYKILKNRSVETQATSTFGDLFSPVIFDNEGRMIAKPEKKEEKIKHEFAQGSLGYFLNFKKQLEAIFQEFNIDEKYFNEKIEKSPYFSETDKIIIKKSIYKYFKGDYIIFLHLMIPRIENILRNFLEKQGGSILGQIKKDGFKYKILGNILDDGIIKETFTEELVEYFKLVLHDDLGLNIRNNLSHGIITAGECNENNSNIVFHILLFLIYM